jgi:rhamnulokinase
VERNEPVLTDAAREAGYTNELGLDGTVRFLKNLTGLWVLQECERAWEEARDPVDEDTVDYDTLQRGAAAAPAREGTLDLDEQRFLERGKMPQKIRRYCREEGLSVPETKGEYTRLILESLAADYRKKLAALEEITGEQIEVLHLVGGGSRNELLCQWTADATRCRVVAGPAEATALGNLFIQARAMGELPEGQSVRDLVRANVELQTYEPDSARTSAS